MNKSRWLHFNRRKIRQRKPQRRTRRAWFEQLEDRRMLAILMVDVDVTPGGDGQTWGSAYNDLQNALSQAATLNADGDASNDIDAIWIAEGTYTPSALLEASDARSASFSLLDGVTLYGGFAGTEDALDTRDWLSHVTTLSGDLGTPDDDTDNAYTVVYCRSNLESVIDGVSISDGNADGSLDGNHLERRFGGGVYSRGTLTVANSRVSSNSAISGGGIYGNGTLTITNSLLAGNSAISGGGVYNDGTLTVTNSTLADNSASYGGGIDNSGGKLTVTNTTLADNSANVYGGGCRNSGTLTVTRSTLSGNSAENSGGGIDNSGGTLTITNSTLAFNSAGSGGGIRNSGTLVVTNSTLSGNSAGYGGGVYYSQDSSSTATLRNTIVAGNAASTGRDLYRSSGTLYGSNNLIGDGSGQATLVHGVDGNQVGTSSSPIDPRLSDWTQFDDGQWGYYLLPQSPALDAGDNALALDATGQALTEDILGNARIQNGTVDIGAVEGATIGAPAQIYTVTSLANTIASDGVLTFMEAFEAASRNQPMGDAAAGSYSEQDSIRFANGLSGTILLADGELVIAGDLSIEGPGAGLLSFDAKAQNRVFFVHPNVSVNLSGMTVTGGSADQGGGIFNDSGTLAVANVTLSDNAAETDGGGIYNTGYGALTVTKTILSDNSAGNSGGGIYSGSGMLIVTNSVLSGNSAGNSGGGISSYSGTLMVTNSTLSGNSSENTGGGIYSRSTATLNNTMVAGNKASSEPDNYRSGGTLSGSHNLIGDGAGQSALVDGVDGNRVGTSSSPIDPLLSDWTQFDNGQWGYYLLPGSPAIDAGDSGLALDTAGKPLAEDILGNTRIQDGTVDIGAVEGATVDSSARTYTVTSLEKTIASDGVLTFVEAFEAANRNQPVGDAVSGSFSEPDVIQFSEGLSGTVVLADGELAIAGALSIEGPGAEFLTFDAKGNNRIFLVRPNVPVSLAGMTITGGSADKGGGILNHYGTLMVANSTLTDNSSQFTGGGIFNHGGTLTVTDSTLSDNWAASGGGGIYNYRGTLTVTSSTLSDNSAASFGGGGIYTQDGPVTVTDSTLSDNSASDAGGGIYNYRSTVTVTNSMLSSNSASVGGGGIYNYGGPLTITSSTLSENSASVDGGGIINNSGMLTVTNSTLWGNSVRRYGGGIINSRGPLTVTNSTLSGNTASYGGGIFGAGDGSIAVLNNTIVAGNGAASGPDVYHPNGTLSGSHNLIGDGSGQSTLVDGVDGNRVGTSSSPIDPMLSDWTQFDNGQWGYYLLPGSPAIDAGDNDLAEDPAGQPLVEDIYRNSRILGSTVDIGAVEGPTAGTSGQTYVVTSLENAIVADGVLTFLEAFEAASRNQSVGDAAAGSFSERDTIQFADGLSGTVLLDDSELVIAGDLSIEGPEAERLTFDATGHSRVFVVRPNVSVSLHGMTITGGSATDGGGIFNFGTLTVKNSTLLGNSAAFGGGGFQRRHVDGHELHALGQLGHKRRWRD